MIELRADDVDILLDSAAPPTRRVAAAKHVAESDDPRALDLLNRLACDWDADAKVVKSAGEGLARIMIRQQTSGSLEYERVAFPDMRPEAFDAYDRALGKRLQSTS
jgi:hypothetical protein